jgi:hypothetical protein
MKIMFDVKGTLDSGTHVQETAKELKSRGHDVQVWSSEYSFAVDMANQLGPDFVPRSKSAKWSYDSPSDYTVDVAVDDDTSQFAWLAAKAFVNVRDLPIDPKKAADLIELRAT